MFVCICVRVDQRLSESNEAACDPDFLIVMQINGHKRAQPQNLSHCAQVLGNLSLRLHIQNVSLLPHLKVKPF